MFEVDFIPEMPPRLHETVYASSFSLLRHDLLTQARGGMPSAG